MGRWWDAGWLWVSLALLVGASVTAYLLGTLHFQRLREALGLPPPYGGRREERPVSASSAELGPLLTSARPLWLTGTGLGALLLILWLMMFKPF